MHVNQKRVFNFATKMSEVQNFKPLQMAASGFVYSPIFCRQVRGQAQESRHTLLMEPRLLQEVFSTTQNNEHNFFFIVRNLHFKWHYYPFLMRY